MTHYLLDIDRSTIEFSIRHLIMKMRGRFTNFAGVIDLDRNDITRSKATVEIDATSISTDDPQRDARLRSAGFFDVNRYPLIQFASERVEEDGHHLRVVGALTMNGLTREVTLRVEPLVSIKGPLRPDRLAFLASALIDRKHFGLHSNQLFEAGGLMVGDKVEIRLDIQGTRAQARAAA